MVNVFNLCNTYLHLTFWVWLTTMIAFDNSPLTRDGHVLLELFPLHCHVTVFVGTGDDFEQARGQVDL